MHPQTFETLVIGPSNTGAVAIARLVASSAAAPPSLLIRGASGTGKSHLLRAIAHAVSERHGSGAVRIYSGEQFVSEYVSAVRTGTLHEFRRRFAGVTTVLLDDVDFYLSSEASVAAFSKILLLFKDTGVGIVATYLQRGTIGTGQRIRLPFCREVWLHPPRWSMRRDMVIAQAPTFGLALDERVAGLLARHAPAEGRAIAGLLNRLRFEHTDLDRRSVQRFLQLQRARTSPGRF